MKTEVGRRSSVPTGIGVSLRMNKAPNEVATHVVENALDPGGKREPALLLVFGALASALYKASGKRFYDQPFSMDALKSRGNASIMHFGTIASP
jgi:hypothetical protein